MALHGPIQVNGQTIGEWEAVRQQPEGFTMTWSPKPDDVLTYACVVRQNTTLEGNPAVYERFEVRHRFGDGALALASLVLRTGLLRLASKDEDD